MTSAIDYIQNDVKNTINNITTLLKSVEPEKIILFGSYAKENQTHYSDLDILVVTNSDFMPKNYSERMSVVLPITKLIREYRKNIPIDLLVYTKPMYSQFLSYDSLMAKEIKNHGIILYEKNN